MFTAIIMHRTVQPAVINPNKDISNLTQFESVFKCVRNVSDRDNQMTRNLIGTRNVSTYPTLS